MNDFTNEPWHDLWNMLRKINWESYWSCYFSDVTDTLYDYDDQVPYVTLGHEISVVSKRKEDDGNQRLERLGSPKLVNRTLIFTYGSEWIVRTKCSIHGGVAYCRSGLRPVRGVDKKRRSVFNDLTVYWVDKCLVLRKKFNSIKIRTKELSLLQDSC